MAPEREENVATPLTTATDAEVAAELEPSEAPGVDQLPADTNGEIGLETEHATAPSVDGVLPTANFDSDAAVDGLSSTATPISAAPERKSAELPKSTQFPANAISELPKGLHCEAHHEFGPDEHGDSVGPLINGSQPGSKQSTPRKPVPANGKNGTVAAALPFQRPPMKRTSLARQSAPVPQPQPVSASSAASQDASAGEGSSGGPDRPPMKPLSLSRRSAPPDLSRTSLSSSVKIQSVRLVEEVPRRAVRAALVVSFNAILMAVAEILIELLIVGNVYPKLPFRLDFFFLTILSALLGIHTLHGVRGGHFDTSRNSLQVGGLVETALIAGDILFMVSQGDDYPAAVPTRLPFLVLTAVNLFLVAYLYVEMYMFHKRELALEKAQAEAEASA